MSRPGPAILAAAVVGLLAGLLAAVVFSIGGEPRIEDAIAIEVARAELDAGAAAADHTATHDPGDVAGSEVQISRSTQRGVGLFGGTALAGAAFGALFGIAWWAMRIGQPDPFRRALVAGAVLATTVTVVPWLKYPPNPPAVGDPDTISQRQASYVALIVVTGLAWLVAFALRQRLRDRRWSEPSVTVGAAAAGLAPVLAAMALLPSQGVELSVPANLIWQFRLMSLTGNAVLWTSLCVGFALLAQRWSAPVPERPPTLAGAASG